MVFSSVGFLFAFLPVVLILDMFLERITASTTARNVMLIIASLLFYSYGEPVYILVMLLSVIINYILARLIARYSSDKGRGNTPFLVISVIVNLGTLCVFKYLDFLIENVNAVSGSNFNLLSIALPIGISFYTFQILSYVIDVYRAPDTVNKNFASLLLYISFFPQLIAGPIIKYHDVKQYLTFRHSSSYDRAIGLNRFVKGLAKKLFLANTMGNVCDYLIEQGVDGISGLTGWVIAVTYSLQIFFDFSGYSDMAIGIGRALGFHFQENFNAPYRSHSMKEFWRRWHMSLSGWFKDYLYIPLGGSRKGKIRTELNKAVVFLLTGLWHGASYNFIIWGGIHGLAVILEDLIPFPGKSDKKPLKAIGYILTMLVVVTAFVFFRADTLSDAVSIVTSMYTFAGVSDSDYNYLLHVATPYAVTMFVIAIIVALLPNRVAEGKDSSSSIKVTTVIVNVILLLLCMVELVSSDYNPFIYFRF